MITGDIFMIFIDGYADLGVENTKIEFKNLLLKPHLPLNQLRYVFYVVIYGLFDV